MANRSWQAVSLVALVSGLVWQADPSLAGVHITGIAVTKSCPPSANEGAVVTCTVTIENQDNLHDVDIDSATNEFPWPNGIVLPIIDCDADANGDGVFSLGPNDGVMNSGVDFTTCSVQDYTVLASCTSGSVFASDQVEVSGVDGDPIPLPGGFGGLPVAASSVNTVEIFCSECGNLSIDGVEECDDGNDNGSAASCCDASCQFKPNGPASCDGNGCTRPDTCTDGECTPGDCADAESCGLCGGVCNDTGSSCDCEF